MKIEDYCAQKAYAEYEKNFLYHNKDNLPEFEKLNFQKRDDFISYFIIDLRKNLTTFLDHFPEDRDTVRKSLTQILKANFDNLQENNILDSSGKIDIETFNIYLGEGVKKNLPEIYLKSQEKQQNKTQSDAQNQTTNSLKENVDFSNSEETKKYFDNFYKNFANCKNREEKLKFIEKGFGISLENMAEQQQDEVISKCEARGKIREIKETLKAEFQEANPDLQGEELEQALESIAVEQYCIKNNKNFETEKNNNDMMVQLESYLCEREKLNQDLFNCHDENKKIKFEKKLNEIEDKITQLIQTLSLTNDEVEKISKDSMEQDKNSRLSETETSANELKDNQSNDDLSDLFMTDENELDTDLSDLFAPNITEPEEDLSDLFTAQELPEIEENPNNVRSLNTDKPAFVNPILTNVKEDDLKQEDYIIEIKEKENLWDKLRNGFSKIKNAIVEKLGLNKAKLLNHQKYLNTAENNTKVHHIYSGTQNSFEQSLIVSKEDQEKYRKEYETSKNISQKNTSSIHTNHEQNIQL